MRAPHIGPDVAQLLGQMEFQLEETIGMVNRLLCQGHAEEDHPQLIAAVIHAIELRNLSTVLDKRLLGISDALAALVDAVDNLKGTIRKVGEGLKEAQL